MEGVFGGHFCSYVYIVLIFLGRKHNVKHIDRFEDVILTKKEQGQDVRDVESHFHEFTASLPPNSRVKKDANLKDKFMYER